MQTIVYYLPKDQLDHLCRRLAQKERQVIEEGRYKPPLSYEVFEYARDGVRVVPFDTPTQVTISKVLRLTKDWKPVYDAFEDNCLPE